MRRLSAGTCLLPLFAVVLTIFSLQGCATVTRGTSEVLVVQSNPSGAKVSVERYRKYVKREEKGKKGKRKYRTSRPTRSQEKIASVYYKDEKFNEMTGTTPTSFKVVRRGQYKVRIEREGYETSIVTVKTQVCDRGSAGMAGNICLGGFIGAAIDVASGSMNRLFPNPVEVALVPLQQEEKAVTEKTIPERLERLTKLKPQKIISEEEYQQKRKEILDGL